MAIGTPTIVGSIGNASTPSSLTVTTTGAIATHDLVVVCQYGNSTTGTATSVTDDSGNVYKQIVFNNAVNPLTCIWYCSDAIAMASSGHVNFPSFNVNAGRVGMYVVNVTGMLNAAGVWDRHTGVLEKSTATSSPSTAILNSASTTQLLLNFTIAGSALGTYTPTTGFTALTALTTNAFMYPEYKILAANTPTNSNPSWVNSVLHSTVSLAFLGNPATNTSRQAQMSLVGVGA